MNAVSNWSPSGLSESTAVSESSAGAGPALSVMVAMAWTSPAWLPLPAFWMSERRSTSVSSPSATASARIGTLTVVVKLPPGMVKLPDCARKSLPASAVPPTTSKSP